ncbi:MAG: diguanylate cyclase [Nitrospirae bacterium]|nr:diguanylate cyclase [Nitrospirota bacterium]
MSPAPVDHAEAGPATVLLVDPDEALAREVTEVLAQDGHKVIPAPTGRRALSAVREGVVDIAIVNADLADVSGFQLLGWLRGKEDRYLPLILLLSDRDAQAMGELQGLQVGADAFLRKPVSAEILRLRVRNLLVLKAGYDRAQQLQKDLEKRTIELEILNTQLQETNTQLQQEKEQAERFRLSLADDLVRSDLLSRFTQNINSFNLEEIRGAIRDQLADVVGIRLFTLFLHEADRQTLRLFAHNHENLTDDMEIRLSEKGIMYDCIQRREQIYVRDFHESPYSRGRGRKFFQSTFAYCVPLTVAKSVIGVLNVNDHPEGYLSEKEMHTIRQVADHMASAISVALSHQKLELLSNVDGLTQTFNHRHIQSLIDREFREARRYQRPLGFLMLDLDHFKLVNDTHGHQYGDEVLRETARLIRETIRDVDMVGRYGGEEFCVLLPQTNLEGTMATAERIRAAVDKHPFRKGAQRLHQTLSLGAVSYPEARLDTKEHLIKLADLALYDAKQSGRNLAIAFRERRAQARLLAEGHIDWPSDGGGKGAKATVKNFSASGLSLYVPDALRVGQTLDFDFQLPHGVRVSRHRGSIVWWQEAGALARGRIEVGIQFNDLARPVAENISLLELSSPRSISGSARFVA